MKISLNLLENSLDFLKESLENYIIADENGTHQSYHADYNNKVKWKMAFINLVQSTELLMKEIISTVSPALIQPNIDSLAEDDKSISFTQCIARLVKFSPLNISNEEIDCLRGSAKMRNRYTHYDVEIASEEIKIKYSTLFALYKRLYEEQSGKDLIVENIDAYKITIITEFASKYTVFRGLEIPKDDIAEYKEEIRVAQLHQYFRDRCGTVVPRIRFGSEEKFYKDIEEGNVYSWEYCDDCGAKQGEYHLSLCDLEICPICGGQALSCNCELVWAEEK